jgi:hypothetical protein
MATSAIRSVGAEANGRLNSIKISWWRPLPWGQEVQKQKVGFHPPLHIDSLTRCSESKDKFPLRKISQALEQKPKKKILKLKRILCCLFFEVSFRYYICCSIQERFRLLLNLKVFKFTINVFFEKCWKIGFWHESGS